MSEHLSKMINQTKIIKWLKCTVKVHDKASVPKSKLLIYVIMVSLRFECKTSTFSFLFQIFCRQVFFIVDKNKSKIKMKMTHVSDVIYSEVHQIVKMSFSQIVTPPPFNKLHQEFKYQVSSVFKLLIGTFYVKNSDRRKNCESRTQRISALGQEPF